MIDILNEDKERTVLRASFLIEIPDKDDFIEAITSYMGCSEEELSNDDVLEFIDLNTSLCRSKSPSVFKIMGAGTNGPFLICTEKEY